MKHLDPSQLVDIVEALEKDVGQKLQHVSSCAECQTEMEGLVRAREALMASIEPRAGFTDDVMGSLPTNPSIPPVFIRMINGMLAAALAFFVLALGGGAGSVIEPGPVMMGAALMAGAAGFTLRSASRNQT